MGVVDATRPQAVNARSGTTYQPGIGPHTESQTISLVMRHLIQASPSLYSNVEPEAPYPCAPRSKCDLRLRIDGNEWAIEAKMLRIMGDNGKRNDNTIMHILSPYCAHRSAFTDCEKLLASGFDARKSILIFGYEYDDFPMDPVLQAFEILASSRVTLSPRYQAVTPRLVHPVHQCGRVVAWEVSPYQ